MFNGVDISYYDGVVNWKLVREAGYADFAIFRATVGLKPDTQFMTNYNNYVQKGRPIGYYAAVHATKITTIRKEANYFLTQLKHLKYPFCVFVDMECKEQKALSKREVTDLLNEWCRIVKKAGYPVGIYTNADWYKREMYPEEIECDMWWIAQYASSSKLFREKALIWQYTSNGHIAGIAHRFDFNKGKDELETWFKRAEQMR